MGTDREFDLKSVEYYSPDGELKVKSTSLGVTALTFLASGVCRSSAVFGAVCCSPERCFIKDLRSSMPDRLPCSDNRLSTEWKTSEKPNGFRTNGSGSPRSKKNAAHRCLNFQTCFLRRKLRLSLRGCRPARLRSQRIATQ